MTPYKNLADCYNRFLRKEAVSVWRKGVLLEIARLQISRGRVLDLGTGTGVGAALLRKTGDYHLTLLDRSQPMLQRASRHADEIILGCMENFSIPGRKFDLIVSGFESVNYLPAASFEKMLRAVKRHLSSKGVFIFDCFSAEALGGRHRTSRFAQNIAGHKLTWEVSITGDRRSVKSKICYFHGERGAKWCECHCQYLLNTETVLRVCSKAGLEVNNVRYFDGEAAGIGLRHCVYSLSSRPAAACKIRRQD